MTARIGERIVWGPWWRAGFIIIGILGIAAIAFAIWLNSDADLRAVERRARADGIVLTWPEASPETLATWMALQKASERCPAWQKDWRLKSMSTWDPICIGVEPPKELIAHHAVLDPTALADVGALIPRLGAVPVRPVSDPLLRDPFYISPLKDLARMLSERMTICTGDELAETCQLLLQISDDGINHRLMVGDTGSTVDYQTLTAIAYRQYELANSSTYDVVLRWLDHRSVDVRMTLEPLLLAEAGAYFHYFETHRNTGFYGQYGQSFFTYDNPIGPFVIRCGRARGVQNYLDVIQFVRACRDEFSLTQEIEHLHATVRPYSRWDSGASIPRSFSSTLWLTARQHLRNTIFSRLLASRFRHQPLPIDPCDPAGGALRPILRDGVMIGAYSIGMDQVDDGGNTRNDFCFALTARLGWPHAADLPPVTPTKPSPAPAKPSSSTSKP